MIDISSVVLRSRMQKHPDVLIVEDSPTLAEMYQDILDSEGIESTKVENGKQALTYINRTPPKIVLLDLNLPDIHGMDILNKVNQTDNHIDFIVITGSNDCEDKTMQLGAQDYLVKPISSKRLIVTVTNILKIHELSNTVCELKNCYEMDAFQGFIGSSPEIQNIYLLIKNSANSKASIFITGESGTGKEVCATAIHQQSQRSDGPFIALNCGAIPKDLIESEIFGHEKGAFTGASSQRKGAAELAHGGTLFLDEICEMHLDLQVKLLRFLQTGTFQRVGSHNSQEVDVRIVCATNKDPYIEVENHRFREDLFYRLHVIPIHLPPLRHRGKDSLLIANKLLTQYAQEEGKNFRCFKDDVKQLILSYHWPGNVRELQNVIRQIVVLNNATSVHLEHVPPSLISDHQEAVDTHNSPLSHPLSYPHSSPSLGDQDSPMEVILTTNNNNQDTANQNTESQGEMNSPSISPLWLEEKRIIEKAIYLCEGNVPKAATLLQVSPSTIYRKQKKWDQLN